MKKKRPFTLKRTDSYWHYRYYDATGKRREVTTDIPSTVAENTVLAYVLDLAVKGLLVPSKDTDSSNTKNNSKVMTFGEYAQGFWDYDGDYLRSERIRGKNHSRKYTSGNQNIVKRYMLPYFSNDPLRIPPPRIRGWLFWMVDDKGLSRTTANKLLGVLSVMLSEAVRQELIESNPCKSVKKLVAKQRIRGILTMEEAKELFSTLEYWHGNCFRYAGNLLAATTGMRNGEVRALRVCDVFPDHVHVEHSFDNYNGLKCTKTDDVRDLPISDTLYTILGQLMQPGKEWVFSLPDSQKPVCMNYFYNGFLSAIHEMGIGEDERQERNLTFHGWRHFLNSQLLMHGISETMTRKITGHLTEEMTQRYFHFDKSVFSGVRAVTDQLADNVRLFG